VERASAASPVIVGRYALYGEIASGGMATVRYGRLRGSAGFARTVAVKQLLEPFARSPEFVSMFVDEARLASRVRHPNVVSILDVVSRERELFLVMEYVHGESLSRLVRAAKSHDEPVPQKTAAAVICAVLHGLHAAHEATSEQGVSLDIVHRDVSPQNILVGKDGIARLLDFGIAKAVGQLHVTREGSVKGKLAYMAPEQLEGRIVDRRADIYATGVVLWELLTGQRLFDGDAVAQTVSSVLARRIEPPSARASSSVSPALDELTLRALSRSPSERFATARQMAVALEECVGVASPAQVGDWVEAVAGDVLSERARVVAEIEKAAAPDFVVASAEAPDLAPTRGFALTVGKTGDRAAKTKSRKAVVIALSAGGLLVAGAAAVAALSSGAGAPGTVSSTPNGASTPETSGTSSVTPAEQASSPAPPAPVATVLPSTSVSTPAGPRAAARPTPHIVPTSKPRCVVKSYVDPDGVKHFFNDCSQAQ
jgi:serine/threonine-protein kinase